MSFVTFSTAMYQNHDRSINAVSIRNFLNQVISPVKISWLTTTHSFLGTQSRSYLSSQVRACLGILGLALKDNSAFFRLPLGDNRPACIERFLMFSYKIWSRVSDLRHSALTVLMLIFVFVRLRNFYLLRDLVVIVNKMFVPFVVAIISTWHLYDNLICIALLRMLI